MARNITNNILPVLLLAPATISATTKSLTLDRHGFEAAAILWAIGIDAALDGSNKWTPSVEESDTDVDANFTAVAAGDLLYAPTVVDSTSEDVVIQRIEYVGTKRYIRLVLTETGTLSGPHAIIGLLGSPRQAVVGAPTVGTTAA